MKRSKTLRTLADLKEHGLASDSDLPLLQEVTQKFNLLIPNEMTNLILNSSLNEGIRKQFLPDKQELQESEQELVDPIGDDKYEKVKGLVHRYPDRCLLKVVSVCPVYCRFCFRKEMIGPKKNPLTERDLKNSYEYIKNHPEIWEVILTGGDPLILKPLRLKSILSSLNEISHVEIVRIHTRIPIVDPERVSEDLINTLKTVKTAYVVLHANHPAEFTANSIAACARIVDAGIPMLSQTVLLKGINDNVATLSELMKTFVRHRIKPYYLHHPDLAKGTSHFRLTISEGQRLVKALQGNISGLCQPTYMLEIPGGAGKMPISPCFMQKEQDHWVVEDYLGHFHRYED